MDPSQISIELDNFALTLLEEKGLTDLDPDTLAQHKDDIIQRALSFLSIMIVQALPDEKLDEYESYLVDGKEEEAQMLCRENIPNFEQFIVEKLNNFRNLYLSSK